MLCNTRCTENPSTFFAADNWIGLQAAFEAGRRGLQGSCAQKGAPQPVNQYRPDIATGCIMANPRKQTMTFDHRTLWCILHSSLEQGTLHFEKDLDSLS